MRARRDPSSDMSAFHRWDSNWRPLSVTIVEGMPKRATQPWTNVRATTSAVIVESGNASGQRVKRSTHVRR